LTPDEFEARRGGDTTAIRNDLRPSLEDLLEYQAVRSDPRPKAKWLD
jgi:hypothetical protein